MLLSSKKFDRFTPTFTLDRYSKNINKIVTDKGTERLLVTEHFGISDPFIQDCCTGKLNIYLHLKRLRFCLRSV